LLGRRLWRFFSLTKYVGKKQSRKFFLIALKPKLVQIMFKNSVRISERTPHFTITKINWLMLFKKIIAVYTMLSGSNVTTAWRVLGLRIEERASRYGG
jgi:hypothetical protein